jgi:hypothetical protein
MNYLLKMFYGPRYPNNYDVTKKRTTGKLEIFLGAGGIFFSTASRPVYGPRRTPSNIHFELFSRGRNGRSVTITGHLYPVLRAKNNEVICP